LETKRITYDGVSMEVVIEKQTLVAAGSLDAIIYLSRHGFSGQQNSGGCSHNNQTLKKYVMV
jgi:hypothetical protein